MHAWRLWHAGRFFYKNKRTGQVYFSKPKFLGEEDLPDPRQYWAPPGYEAPQPKIKPYAMVGQALSCPTTTGLP
jgi:hypothetical protein